MDGLVITLLALLAGAVLYLLQNQRHFQRVDYGELVRQEEREKRLSERIAQLEDMLAEAREYAVAFSVISAQQGSSARPYRPTEPLPQEAPPRRRTDTLLVAELLVAGYSVQETARQLGLSESEVGLAAELAAAGRF